MIHFEIPETQNSIVKIIGVGGGGSNAVTHMQETGTEGVDLIICNTDSQALANSPVTTKIQLGPYITQGLGAGANPEVGEKAAEESMDELKRILETNTKMVFITAGMGGGTGTGGAPIIARICQDLGILTVAIVTTPFFFEGRKRMKYALSGIEKLKDTVDTIIVISNDKLREQCGDLTFLEAFGKADDILATAANCITSVIKKHDRVNTDFADVNTVMRNGGVGILGRASAVGSDRALVATEEALNSPLLNNNDIEGAKWLLVNISSSDEHAHTMDELAIIENYLYEQVGDDCEVILGMGVDDTLGEAISVTVIATGFSEGDNPEAEATRQRIKERENRTIFNLGEDEPVNGNGQLTNGLSSNGHSNGHYNGQSEGALPNLLDIQNGMNGHMDEDEGEDPEPTGYSDQVMFHDSTIVEDTAPTPGEKIYINLEDDNTIDIGDMFYGSSATEEEVEEDDDEITLDVNRKIEQELSAAAEVASAKSTRKPGVDEQLEDSPNEDLYLMYGIPKKKGIRVLTEEERKDLLEFEMRKQELENRAEGLFSLKSDIVPPTDEKYMRDVPAIEREDHLPSAEGELDTAEGYLSGYRVTNDDITNNKLISSINNFLHGKKPD